ncbi:MAG: RluA family pseudouridine synthase [Gallionella sp.]|nr:RluA family pseudouridine synthase [Gallionella sp.]
MSTACYSPPRDCGLDLIYRDESIIVVNKPAGLLSVPGRGADKTDSLTTRVQKEFPDALNVHRLDMSTSGLIVLARGKEMHRRISAMFRERRVEKRYLAIVAGQMEAVEGEVDLPLGADWPNRPRQKVDFAIGKPSLTRYRVFGYEKSVRAEPVEACFASNHSPFDKLGANGPADMPAGATRVELEPVTGRTHQLRVHMAAIGHPIQGDALYGGDARGSAVRLMLHASVLNFAHPLGEERLSFECAPPF